METREARGVAVSNCDRLSKRVELLRQLKFVGEGFSPVLDVSLRLSSDLEKCTLRLGRSFRLDHALAYFR